MWNRVKSEHLSINSAKEYYEEASKSCKEVRLFFVSSEEIDSNEEILNERWEVVTDKISVSLQKQKSSECKKKEIGLNSLHFFEKSTDSTIFAARTVESELHEIRVFDGNAHEDSQKNTGHLMKCFQIPAWKMKVIFSMKQMQVRRVQPQNQAKNQMQVRRV